MQYGFLAATSVLAALVAPPALAADMRVKAAAIPAPVAVHNWTGCYLGAHLGGAWARKNVSDQAGTTFGTPGLQLFSIDAEDIIGGGQVGCNYQFAPTWVLGLEGDFSGTGIKGHGDNTLFATAGALSATEFLSFNAKTSWLATATARLGYAQDRWLYYIKGGAAWAGDKYDYQGQGSFCNGALCSPPIPVSGSGSETRPGWTFGGGVEWAVWDRWSVNLEYDYYDLGARGVTFVNNVGASFGNPPQTLTAPLQVEQKLHTFKLGINYQFGVSSSPAGARY